MGARCGRHQIDRENRMIQATFDGNLNIVKNLIKCGADVNFQQESLTALMIASSQGHEQIVQILIDNRDTNADIRDDLGETALMKAVSKKYVKIVKMLLDNKAKVNILDNKGQTALMKAVKNESNDIAKMLIDKAAKINIADKDGNTALIYAAGNDKSEIVSELMDEGASMDEQNNQGQTALIKAADCQNTTIVLALLHGKVAVDIVDNELQTALMKAAYHGNNDIALHLIRKGAKLDIVDRNKESALMIAARKGNEQITRTLIKKSVKGNIVDKKGKTALILAILHENNEFALTLLNDNNTDISVRDNEGRTALMCATFKDNDEITKALIKRGAEVNEKDCRGRTELIKSASEGKAKIVQTLIEGKAKVDIIDNEGQTALIKAIRYQHTEIAEVLIKAGAALNIADENGKTALMWAADQGNNNISLALMHARADVNVQDKDGRTALMFAIKYKDVTVALIQQGEALVNTFDHHERNALFYAILEANNVPRYLLDNGADLERTNSFNVSVLSSVLYHCINEKVKKSEIQLMLRTIRKTHNKQKTFKAIINAIFCKLLFYFRSTNENILPMLQTALHLINGGKNDSRRLSIKSIIDLINQQDHIFELNEVETILLTLLNLGADPNTADERGNTALHYFVKFGFVASKISKSLDNTYKKLGFSLNKTNLKLETPLLFCLSSALEDVKQLKNALGNTRKETKTLCIKLKNSFHNLILICGPLLKDSHSINVTSQSGKSLFQVIIQLAQEILNFKTSERKTFEVQELRELFDESILKLLALLTADNAAAAVKCTDNRGNSLLHYWASVELPSFGLYAFQDDRDNYEYVIKTILEKLVECGALIKSKNQNGEAALHLCKTWTAVKLLVNKKANINDVDEAKRTPLLAAAHARNRECPNYFYPDVIDIEVFWTDVCNTGLNILAFDKYGNSVISILLSNNAVQSVKSLIKAIFAQGSISSYAFKSIFQAIDKATKDVYNKELVKLILDLTSPTQQRLVIKEANNFPSLKKFIERPLSKWESYSEVHKEKLKIVQESKYQESCLIASVENTAYWYHKTHIGSGAFGYVFAGINENDGMEVAIKRCEKLRMTRPEVQREIQNLIALKDSQNIVQYLYFWEIKDFAWIVLELMEGNLDDFFQRHCNEPSSFTKEFVKLSNDIVTGLKYLHSKNILHRDLKPSNILYKTNPNLCLKIADFGLSCSLDKDLSVTVMSKSVGTRGWIAPEVLKSSNNSHSKSSDIFSCGLVLHYLFAKQQHPFNPVNYHGMSDEQILIKREGNILKYRLNGWSNSLSPEVFHLVQNMIAKDDTQRPSASDSLNHPMFWSDERKITFLCAVGDQEEFECPRANRPLFTAVENQLDANLHTVVRFGKWDDAGYKDMNNIITETTKPVKRSGKKGKSYGQKVRKDYKKDSVVELVRFIRNAVAHASSDPIISALILKDAIFLEYFPDLVMVVYKAVMDHGWNRRDKIKHVIENQ